MVNIGQGDDSRFREAAFAESGFVRITVTLRYGAGEDDTIGGRKGPPGTPIINSKTTGPPNITINRGHAERQGETEHWPRLGDRHNKQYPDKGVGLLAARV